MSLGFELVINFIEVTIIFDFLARYFEYRDCGRFRYIGTAIVWIIAFLVVSYFSLSTMFEIISTLLAVITNFIFCILLLKGELLEKAFISTFVMAITAVVSTGTALIFSNVFNQDISQILSSFNFIRATALIISQTALFWSTRIILQFKLKSELSLYDSFILATIPICSIIAISFLISIAIKSNSVQGYVLGSVVMIAFINVFVYYFFVRISMGNKVKHDFSLLELQYTFVHEKSVETQQLYNEVQAARHDLKNHLLCIESMAAEHNSCDIQKYIHELLQEAEVAEHTILFTGNNILDAILNMKLSMAEHRGIFCTTIITYPQIPLSQSDICVLFGNLLDNAIEAAVKSSAKILDIKIARQCKYVYVHVQNSTAAPVLKENPELLTSKQNKILHGFGIRNIKKIVERYNGIIQYQEDKAMFCCDILIPI